MKSPRKMISSSAPDRSFLYGNRSLKISDELVYATLDCLALKGATLPLKLLPIDDNEIANANQPDKKERKFVRRKSTPRRPCFKVPPPGSTQYKKVRPKINHTKADGLERRDCPAAGSSGCARKVHRRTQNNEDPPKPKQSNGKVEEIPKDQTLEPHSCSAEENSDAGLKVNNQLRSQSLCQLDRVDTRQGIYKASSVGQFDTEKKNTKKKADFWFRKNVLHCAPISSHVQRCCNLAKKSSEIFKSDQKIRASSLGLRDDVRNLTISTPTNFVHVASATSPKLITVEARTDSKQTVIYHEPKFADLRSHENPEEMSDDECAKKNSSFLYSPRSLLGDVITTGYSTIKKQPEKAATERCEEKKTRTIEVVDQNGSAKKNSSPVEPSSNRSFLWSISQTKVPSLKVNDEALEEDDIYDDVGCNSESIYDDVGPSRDTEQKSSYAFDDDDYDDVFPTNLNQITKQPSFQDGDRVEIVEPSKTQITSKEEEDSSKKRNSKDTVNDCYLPKTQGNVNVCIDSDDAKNEGEDSLYDDVDLQCQDRINSLYGDDSIVIKESELANFKISLSSYNVDQISPTDQSSVKQVSPQQTRQPSVRSTKSFSSLSTIGDPENSDATSDENNYESLTIGEFDSDSETETMGSYDVQQVSTLEAPTKPNPPPPKEASLTQSLSKILQMQLKLNWTLTKGSLDRIRRKSSVDTESNEESPKITSSPMEKSDTKKYFSFKRKSKKTRPSVSTFYTDGIDNELKNSHEKEDVNNKNICDYGWKDSDSSHSDVSDFKEPLYQFYTAETVRIASQSDSDGYDEVEKRALLKENGDKPQPLHLLLWCQTPQVINSGLLDKLTVEEKKLQEAKFEILTSEVRYLNSLRVLDNEFANDHELIHEVLTPGERERLFPGVETVLAASENFLTDLQSVWNDDPMMNRFPEVILKHIEKFLDVYFTYCSKQVLIEGTLKELKTKKEQSFLDTVQKIERRPACQHLPLHSFLMLPMQRVTRLPLLADAVLSKLPVDHNQRSSWEEAFSNLNYVVAQCNEGARRAGQRAELKALERKLIYPINVKPITLEGRELVRSGPVIHLTLKSEADYKLTFGKKFQKTPLYLFLLTDYLLVTKPKTNGNSIESTYTVIDTCKRNLVTLASVEKDSPFSGYHAMVLDLLENCAGRTIEFVLTCGSDTEVKRWLNTFTPLVETMSGETLYESWDCPQVTALFAYTPVQPDELALQVGDVINVLKKSEGWYYGTKLLDEKQGWFPANYTQEIESEHVRARNLRQRHRFLAMSAKHIMNLKAKN